MTKREKIPPLKPWQQEIVKKHEYQRWLRENGDPHQRAKIHFIEAHKMNEKTFDEFSDQLEKTEHFKALKLAFSLQKAFGRLKNIFKKAGGS